MQTVVKVERVSKEYRLGVSRTSLLSGLSKSMTKVFKPQAQDSGESRILWALRDVSFELSQGEALGLIGQNGAGKSTLLKLLANITHPTSGQIDVHGRLSALIELGSGFHGDLTGRENIFLNGTILGLSRDQIKRRFDEIVAFSEIERFIETPVKRYSSGMLVRLGFAVASCIEPDILLVDEVLAVGDASFRQKCLNRIRSLLVDGTSIIFVSHDLNMVQGVCTSTLYIKRGQIQFRGQTKDAIAAYERDLHEERARKFAASSEADQQNSATDVQITRIEVLDANGLNAGEFRNDQPLEIRVRYHANRSIREANAVIRIVRSDGLTICRMRTSIDKFQLALPQGEGVLSLMLEPLQLTGGTYFVFASIKTEMDLVLLDSRQSEWFYVLGAPLSHTEDNGFFEPRRRWEHHPPAPHQVRVDNPDGKSLTASQLILPPRAQS